MLRPIFDQKSRRDGQVAPELARALEWWLVVLNMDLAEVREWHQSAESTVHLLCDASGSPPQLGAVLFTDGVCYWTQCLAEPDTMKYFASRSDQQIMGLELLAISLGLCTFEHLLRGRNVVVHCDNTGSEVGVL